MYTKNQLRKEILHNRSVLNEQARQARAASTATLFLGSSLFENVLKSKTQDNNSPENQAKISLQYTQNPHTVNVGAYIPQKTEPNILPLLTKLEDFSHTLNKAVTKIDIRLWVPLIAPKNKLKWTQYSSETPLHYSAFAPVLEPHLKKEKKSYDYCELVEKKSDFDMIFIPSLAINQEGSRLGQGGGYYDRFFNDNASVKTKIGYIYDDEFRNDFKTESHDQKVDYILSEKQFKKL